MTDGSLIDADASIDSMITKDDDVGAQALKERNLQKQCQEEK